MKRQTATLVRAFALSGIGLYAGMASAEYEIYNRDKTKLVFNMDFAAAGFANSNSWFGESESFLGDDTDNWSEFGAEPRFSFEAPLGNGTVFGQLSGVYTTSFDEDASGLTIGLGNVEDFTTEQAHIGWRVDDLFPGLTDDTFSISGGNQDYTIGSGLLIADGGGDGGDRGGWYIGMRKAFHNTGIVRLKSKELLAEGFYLENDPRAGGTRGNVTGGNFEYTFGASPTLGATYMVVDAEIPGSDTLDVFSGRLTWEFMKDLTFSGEYVDQSSDQIDANGWYTQLSYAFQGMAWSPVLSYRYASFSGDDPNTVDDERFHEIAYGYTDYGTWYQGEITGNYPLGNGNLDSHLVRVKAQPMKDVTLNVLYYNFTLDVPASLGPGVTSDDWGDEIDFTVDWAATEKLYIIGVVGMLFPGDAAAQWVGGDEDWTYGMLYGSYSW